MGSPRYKRYLKYPLHPADVLFFRCIPGTHGETLYPILEAHFPAQAVFPPSSADSEKVFTAYSEAERAGFRLVRGDLEYGTGDLAVYRYLAPNPIKITFLSDPIPRAVALHRTALARGSVPPGSSLGDYVASEAGRLALCNAQARAIVGLTTRAAPGHDTLGYSPEAFKRLAQDNLEQHHFFGLAEAWDESMQLLSYTFDWAPASPEPPDAPRATAEEERLIAERAGLDCEFYVFAQSLFRARYRQMVDELLEAASEHQAAPAAANPWTEWRSPIARLARAVRRRLRKRGPDSKRRKQSRRPAAPKES